MQVRLRLLSVLGLLLIPSVWADESQAGKPGFCAIGGEVIAVPTDEGKLHLLPNYRTLHCTYTNGQDAQVAVCEQHRYHHDETDYPAIWDGITRGWAADMDKGAWPKARRNKYWAFYEGVTIQSCDE